MSLSGRMREPGSLTGKATLSDDLSENENVRSSRIPAQKSKRSKSNTELLLAIRASPCIVCGVVPSQAHHVTTRKAGGKDEKRNLMPLCARHHYEWHLSGPGFMIEDYYQVYDWLVSMNRGDVLDRAKRR